VINDIMKKTLLFSKETIRLKVQELASQISSDYEGKEPIFIGILNGAVFFLSDLVRELSIPVKMDFIRASSYGSEMVSSAEVQLTKDIEIPVQGKPVILVEDIVDTGLTLSYIMKNLEHRHPESIKICSLINKLERREVSIQVDYSGFQIEEGFIVGYGLDYDEDYRQLPDIYVLN
jgi:hypoxanthine phosphoribosyltransferase